MVQCGMTAAGVRSGATQWSSAVWIQPWQGSMGRYGFNWPCQGLDSVGHWQRTREAACRRAGVSQGDESKILLAIGSKTLQAIHVPRDVRRIVKRWPPAARRDKRRDSVGHWQRATHGGSSLQEIFCWPLATRRTRGRVLRLMGRRRICLTECIDDPRQRKHLNIRTLEHLNT